MISLICADCGEAFEASKNRKIPLCKTCAELRRAKRMGPIQRQRAEAGGASSIRLHTEESKMVDFSRAGGYLDYYIDRFRRYPVYDGVKPDDLDIISDFDRRLANTLAARMGKSVWQPLIGMSIREVGDWDLIHMTDHEWRDAREVLSRLLNGMMKYPGIGAARLTKGLHRKRPGLIPVCDSVVFTALNVPEKTAEGALQCMDRLRDAGRAHNQLLGDLRKSLEVRRTPLSELRILEIVLWVAHGPFPPESARLT